MPCGSSLDAHSALTAPHISSHHASEHPHRAPSTRVRLLSHLKHSQVASNLAKRTIIIGAKIRRSTASRAHGQSLVVVARLGRGGGGTAERGTKPDSDSDDWWNDIRYGRGAAEEMGRRSHFKDESRRGFDEREARWKEEAGAREKVYLEQESDDESWREGGAGRSSHSRQWQGQYQYDDEDTYDSEEGEREDEEMDEYGQFLWLNPWVREAGAALKAGFPFLLVAMPWLMVNPTWLMCAPLIIAVAPTVRRFLQAPFQQLWRLLLSIANDGMWGDRRRRTRRSTRRAHDRGRQRGARTASPPPSPWASSSAGPSGSAGLGGGHRGSGGNRSRTGLAVDGPEGQAPKGEAAGGATMGSSSSGSGNEFDRYPRGKSPGEGSLLLPSPGKSVANGGGEEGADWDRYYARVSVPKPWATGRGRRKDGGGGAVPDTGSQVLRREDPMANAPEQPAITIGQKGGSARAQARGTGVERRAASQDRSGTWGQRSPRSDEGREWEDWYESSRVEGRGGSAAGDERRQGGSGNRYRGRDRADRGNSFPELPFLKHWGGFL